MNWVELKTSIRQIVASTLGLPAKPVDSVVEPFDISNEMVLDFAVDGKTFAVTFPEMVAATAVDIVAVIGDYASGYLGKIRLSSGLFCGKDSRIQVLGGTANAILQFSTNLNRGSGLADAMLIWAKQAQPHIDFTNKGLVLLDIIADRSIGSDEIRKSIKDNVVILTQVGPRIVTVSIQSECISNLGADFAFHWLSQIRNYLFQETTRNIMRSANVSFIDAGEVKMLPNFLIDDREYSKANLDVRFGYVSEHQDETFDGTYIDTIEVNSPFTDYVTNPIVMP